MSTIKIILVDDHKLLTDTWILLLNNDPRFEVIGAANQSDEAVPLIIDKKPDIVLLDIAMHPIDGYTLTPAILSLVPPPKIIAISLYSMPAFAKKMIHAGAKGYITKNSSKDELFQAISDVYYGSVYLCREIKDKLAFAQLDPDEFSVALDTLTIREFDIIENIKLGLSSREISERLGVTPKTVEVHRYNIMKKLGQRNTASLINLISSRGL